MAEPSPAERERLLNDYVDLWNGDRSKLDVVSESIVVSDPGAPEGEIRGRDAFESYLEDLRTGFPDFHVEIDDMLVGDDVVMGEWTVTATHEGEFNGVSPTGREMELVGMDKIRFGDDGILEHRIYYDVKDMFEQLGLADA